MSDPSTTDPQPDDPYVEPANSTVDDWHGQEVQRDIETADEALAKAAGDEKKAEAIFDDTRQEHQSERFKVPEDDRPA
jgi:hypothetical protein